MISRSNSCMLRYVMILSIRTEAFFATFMVRKIDKIEGSLLQLE